MMARLRFARFRELVWSCALLVVLAPTPANAVSPSDCADEQRALISANIDDTIFPESRLLLPADYVRNQEDEVRRYTLGEEIPWHIKDSNQVEDVRTLKGAIDYKNSETREDLEVLASFDVRPWQRMADDRFSPETYKKNVAKRRLEICFFNVRASELGDRSGSTQSPSAGSKPFEPVFREHPFAPPAPVSCSNESAESANRESQQIEERLEAFKQSPPGRQRKSPFPHLQMVMWSTDEQAKIIRKHCGEREPFKARLTELKSAYDSAYQACLAIMGDWGPCGPFSPEELQTIR